ncbi:hypothetical protein OB919_01560 [Halobacteria archaeon AArc-curdl1]|uniref:DUF2171 domain-containing protein n=1 Tax=Natronosalvus hydrolyticus TaxID=2979988 RepID=A0AAP2Z4S7_9EURY|nr:hypothetical protein [Halobacteria archaeon AArc-curdl1]
MCAPFTDHDVGKAVENEEGEDVGVVASVADGVAYVLPADDAVDSGADADRPRRLRPDSVRAITEETVRLEGGLPPEDEAADAERYRGLEADPIELAGGDGDPVTPDEFSVEPDEDTEPTDAAVEPDDEDDAK